MSEVLQGTLIDYKCSFPDFGSELVFWNHAAHRVCKEMLREGVDDFNPKKIAECIEERYPVTQPINADKHDVLMEELAEVCDFYDGAHGYRGVWISERLNYGGINE